jgi:GTP-binding protein LepA
MWIRCWKRWSNWSRRRRGDTEGPLRALIFDSHYDSYKGVVAYVRVMEGSIRATDSVRLMATGLM